MDNTIVPIHVPCAVCGGPVAAKRFASALASNRQPTEVHLSCAMRKFPT